VDDFGARWYDSPRTQRWLSPDPVTSRLYDPLSLNKYSYVRNDPVNLIDPDGLSAVTVPETLISNNNCAALTEALFWQYGYTTLQDLFDSSMGILALMSFFEQQGNGTLRDISAWVAMDWTMINRYTLSYRDKQFFYGARSYIPATFEETVTHASDVFSAGKLRPQFTDTLMNILSGSLNTNSCSGLTSALYAAFGVTHAYVYHETTGQYANPVPGALFFNSNDTLPSRNAFSILEIAYGKYTWIFYALRLSQQRPASPGKTLPIKGSPPGPRLPSVP